MNGVEPIVWLKDHLEAIVSGCPDDRLDDLRRGPSKARQPEIQVGRSHRLR